MSDIRAFRVANSLHSDVNIADERTIYSDDLSYDPYIENVEFCLNFNKFWFGTDDVAGRRDLCGKTFYNPYYYAGLSDYSISDYYVNIDQTVMQYGSDDFTVEFIANITHFVWSLSETRNTILTKRANVAATDHPFLFNLYDADGGAMSIQFLDTGGQALNGTLSGGRYGTYPWLDKFSHYAFCKKGKTLYSFIDGRLSGAPHTNNNFGSLKTNASQIFFGGDSDLTNCAYMQIRAFRSTKGVARYTSDFPPVLSGFSYKKRPKQKTVKLASEHSGQIYGDAIQFETDSMIKDINYENNNQNFYKSAIFADLFFDLHILPKESNSYFAYDRSHGHNRVYAFANEILPKFEPIPSDGNAVSRAPDFVVENRTLDFRLGEYGIGGVYYEKHGQGSFGLSAITRQCLFIVVAKIPASPSIPVAVSGSSGNTFSLRHENGNLIFKFKGVDICSVIGCAVPDSRYHIFGYHEYESKITVFFDGRFSESVPIVGVVGVADRYIRTSDFSGLYTYSCTSKILCSQFGEVLFSAKTAYFGNLDLCKIIVAEYALRFDLINDMDIAFAYKSGQEISTAHNQMFGDININNIEYIEISEKAGNTTYSLVDIFGPGASKVVMLDVFYDPLVSFTVNGSNGGKFSAQIGSSSFSFNPNGEFSALTSGEFADTSIGFVFICTDYTIRNIKLKMRIIGVNDLPVVTAYSEQISNGGSTSGNIMSLVSDVDNESFIVSKVFGSSANVGVTVEGIGGGVFTMNEAGDWTFDSGDDFLYKESADNPCGILYYTVRDSSGGETNSSITIFVESVVDSLYWEIVGAMYPLDSSSGALSSISQLQTKGITNLNILQPGRASIATRGGKKCIDILPGSGYVFEFDFPGSELMLNCRFYTTIDVYFTTNADIPDSLVETQVSEPLIKIGSTKTIRCGMLKGQYLKQTYIYMDQLNGVGTYSWYVADCRLSDENEFHLRIVEDPGLGKEFARSALLQKNDSYIMATGRGAGAFVFGTLAEEDKKIRIGGFPSAYAPNLIFSLIGFRITRHPRECSSTMLRERIPPYASAPMLSRLYPEQSLLFYTDSRSNVEFNIFENYRNISNVTRFISSVNGNPSNVGIQVAGTSGGFFIIHSDGSVLFQNSDTYDRLIDEYFETTVSVTINSHLSYTVMDVKIGIHHIGQELFYIERFDYHTCLSLALNAGPFGFFNYDMGFENAFYHRNRSFRDRVSNLLNPMISSYKYFSIQTKDDPYSIAIRMMSITGGYGTQFWSFDKLVPGVDEEVKTFTFIEVMRFCKNTNYNGKIYGGTNTNGQYGVNAVHDYLTGNTTFSINGSDNPSIPISFSVNLPHGVPFSFRMTRIYGFGVKFYINSTEVYSYECSDYPLVLLSCGRTYYSSLNYYDYRGNGVVIDTAYYYLGHIERTLPVIFDKKLSEEFTRKIEATLLINNYGEDYQLISGIDNNEIRTMAYFGPDLFIIAVSTSSIDIGAILKARPRNDQGLTFSGIESGTTMSNLVWSSSTPAAYRDLPGIGSNKTNGNITINLSSNGIASITAATLNNPALNPCSVESSISTFFTVVKDSVLQDAFPGFIRMARWNNSYIYLIRGQQYVDHNLFIGNSYGSEIVSINNNIEFLNSNTILSNGAIVTSSGDLKISIDTTNVADPPLQQYQSFSFPIKIAASGVHISAAQEVIFTVRVVNSAVNQSMGPLGVIPTQFFKFSGYPNPNIFTNFIFSPFLRTMSVTGWSIDGVSQTLSATQSVNVWPAAGGYGGQFVAIRPNGIIEAAGYTGNGIPNNVGPKTFGVTVSDGVTTSYFEFLGYGNCTSTFTG